MAAGDVNVTIVGNLTNDPELRFTPSGAAVASFTVASTPRVLDKATNEWKDGEALFMRCSVWRQYAENVAESLTKGSRVIVTGRLKQRSYETREGEKRTVYEIEAAGELPAEVRVIVDPDLTSVYWPLENGRCRWGFQIRAAADHSASMERLQQLLVSCQA